MVGLFWTPIDSGDLAEVRPFRKILTHETVRVLVQAALPGMVRRGEEEPCTERLSHLGVTRELLPVVRRDRVDQRVQRQQHSEHRVADRVRRLPADQRQKRVFRRTVHQRHQRAAAALPDDRVRLPVADPLLRLRHRRTLGDVHAARDVPATRMTAALPVRPLSPAAEEQVELATSLPIGADVPAGPLPARHRDALLPETAGDLLGAPAVGQPVLHQPPPLRRHLPGNRRGRAAPCRSLPLRLPVPIAAAAAVPTHLAPDRRPVPAQLPRDGWFRKPAFPQRANLAPFFPGQVAVALWHGGLLVSQPGLSPPSGPHATSCAEKTGTRYLWCCTSEWNGGCVCTPPSYRIDFYSSKMHFL